MSKASIDERCVTTERRFDTNPICLVCTTTGGEDGDAAYNLKKKRKRTNIINKPVP